MYLVAGAYGTGVFFQFQEMIKHMPLEVFLDTALEGR